MFEAYKNHILLHFIILLFGFTGILGKLIDLDAVSMVFHRVLIASVSLFIFMLILKRPLKVQSRKRFVGICLTGLVVGAHWITFFQAVQLSTASFGVLCLSTTTLHVSWLEPLVMKRKFSKLEFGLSLVVVLGIFLVTEEFSGNQLKALFFGLTSALLAATFSVFNAKYAQTEKPSTITLYEMIMATVAIAILLAATGNFNTNLWAISVEDIGWLLFLGIVCTSFAFLAIVELVKHLGAFTVSLSINLEPVYAIVLGILILNENQKLGMQFYLGSVIIVLVIFANAILKSYLKKKKNSSNMVLDKDLDA
ncbi:DMT family transporter [Crocinitomicaceae bacterium]|nr:DMT family transporter [Crocinitomicaceae bacterium]